MKFGRNHSLGNLPNCRRQQKGREMIKGIVIACVAFGAGIYVGKHLFPSTADVLLEGGKKLFEQVIPPAQSAEQHEPIVLCAGAKGRNYDAVMQSVATELEKRGHGAIVQNLSGSEDILSSINAGRCSAGIAQKDVYWGMTQKNASLGSGAVPKEVLYNEAMTLVCTDGSGIDELEDITSDTTVITDAIGSGSALTWDTMKLIEEKHGGGSAWASAQVVNIPLREAFSQMALGSADCAFGVGAVPSGWAKEMEEAGYTVSWIYDKDLNDLVVGKSSLYSSVRVPYGSYETKFDTYLIPAVLFMSNKTPLDQEVEDLIRRVSRSTGSKFDTKVK